MTRTPRSVVLLVALQETVLLSGGEIRVGASIGISMYPGDGLNKDELFQFADAAMYRAKAPGRNGCCFYHGS